jgi:dolichol-phosphate mannosyltransferase
MTPDFPIPMLPYKYTVDVILPSYNEHEVVAECVKRVVDEFKSSTYDVRVVVVLDGPDEVAVSALLALRIVNLKIITLDTNRGKGEALRSGIKVSEANYIAFIDADLDIHPDALLIGIDLLQINTSAVCAYGSKVHPESTVDYPILRRLMSFAFRVFQRIFLKIDVNDTQTGLKVFRSRELKEVLEFSKETGFLFDLELLMLLSRRNYRFIPVPISLNFQFNSSINFRTAFGIICQAVNLRRSIKKY